MPIHPAPAEEVTGIRAADAVGTDVAVTVVTGTLSSDPVTTDLASGSVLVRYEVTSRHADGTDTAPVVWYDPPRPPALQAGDRVVVTGRVRRRFYRAGGATRSSTEIVAASVSREGATRRAQAALSLALEQVAGS
ncbi:hypothetical protein [Actinospongicola halichondriae]|uniref:hypothetical protein n=1 Tax=Actinospongicola halichondriae TaxID=3236844 RepID=UPI003D410335